MITIGRFKRLYDLKRSGIKEFLAESGYSANKTPGGWIYKNRYNMLNESFGSVEVIFNFETMNFSVRIFQTPTLLSHESSETIQEEWLSNLDTFIEKFDHYFESLGLN